MAFVRLRAEMDQAEPRACLEFSQDALDRRVGQLSPTISSLDPAAPFQADVSGNLLCLGGLPLEPERQVTIREGLPSQSGERTEYDETFTLTFGDRPAYVGFAGGGVILPRAEADGIAIETVNVSKLEVEVLRVPDRILSQYQLEPGETNEEGGWDYWGFNGAGEDVGVQVYRRRDRRRHAQSPQYRGDHRVRARRGAAAKCAPALMSSKCATRRRAPASAARAKTIRRPRPIAGSSTPTWRCRASPAPPGSTSWCARCARRGRWRTSTLTLIAENNEELARARTDGEGRVHFAEALVNGEGPARARYVMAYGARRRFRRARSAAARRSISPIAASMAAARRAMSTRISTPNAASIAPASACA